MKKIFLPFTLILFLASCAGGNSEENKEKESDNENKLTACECADLMKKNPTTQPGAENRDRAEMQKEWDEIWAPCADNDAEFMQEVLKCGNETSNDSNKQATSDNENKLTPCECADLMKKNPTIQPGSENRDRAEMQKEWEEIWAPCADNDAEFMMEVMKCNNNK